MKETIQFDVQGKEREESGMQDLTAVYGVTEGPDVLSVQEATEAVEQLAEDFPEENDELLSDRTPPCGVWRRLYVSNAGVGVIEILLILVVLVALVLLFKNQLTGMVERAMEALEKSMERILS